MYRERYRPKKYEHFRRRRLRNRLMYAFAAVAALALVAAAVLLLGHAVGFGRSPVVLASVGTSQPAASASAMAFASATPAALNTATSTDGTSAYPTADAPASGAATNMTNSPSATVTPTPSLSASPAATASATATVQGTASAPPSTGAILNPAGSTIETRFNPPQGYQRVTLYASSFGAWLRGHALLGNGVAPKRWDGKDASLSGSAAVLDMDVTSPLQQATETAIRLRAQYLYETGQYSRIDFHFASGFIFQWSRWSGGERIHTTDKTPTWRSEAQPDSSPANLASYLDVQYNYTNIHSLTALDLMPVSISDLTPGDVLVNMKGSVAFVADMASNTAGQRVVLLMSGGTPARQLTILDNPGSSDKPWYTVPADGKGSFRLNDYGYDWSVLMRFRP